VTAGRLIPIAPGQGGFSRLAGYNERKLPDGEEEAAMSWRLPVWSILVGGVLGGASASAAAPPARLSPAQRQRVAEGDRLAARARALLQAGKHVECRKTLQTLLAIRREVHGTLSAQTASVLAEMGTLAEQRDDLAAARKLRAERLTIIRRLYREGDWRTTDARLDLEDTVVLAGLDDARRRRLRKAVRLHEEAARLFRQGKHAQAQQAARTAVAIRKEVLTERHRLYVLSLANLGVFQTAGGDLTRGLATLEQARVITREVLGERHPDYIVRLSNLGYFRMQAGEYARARPNLEQAVALTAALLGKDHPSYPHRLRVLGQVYLHLDDHARARPLLEQARDLLDASQSERGASYATVLSDLASAHLGSGDHARARALYAQAAAIYRAGAGQDNLAYATALNNLALAHQAAGEHRQALELLEKVLAIKKKTLGPEHNSYATTLHNLAAVHEHRGDLARARALYEKGRDICRAAVGKYHPDHATSLVRLAELYERSGQRDRAIDAFTQAAAIARAAYSEKSSAYLAILTRLAVLHAVAGDYARSKPLVEKATEITRALRGTGHIDYARSLQNLAEIHRAVHDWSEAVSLYQQALRIKKEVLGEQHHDYALTLTALGALYREMGELDTAQKLLQRACDITQAALGDRHPDLARRLNSLAVLHMSKKEHAAARALLERAVPMLKKARGERDPDYLDTLDNLGDLYAEMGDLDRARGILERTLAARKAALGELHPDYALTLRQRGMLHLAEGEHVKSETALAEALGIKCRHADVTSAVLNQRQSLTVQSDVRFFLSDYVAAALAARVAPGRLHEVVLRTRGVVANRQFEQRLARDEPGLAGLLERLRLARAGLARLQAGAPSPAGAKEWEDRFRELEAQRDALETALAQRSVVYRWQRQLSSDRLRKALPKRAALVEFLEYDHRSARPDKKGWTSERRLLAFVVRPGHKVALLPLGKARPVSEAVAAWYRPFRSVPPGRLDEKAAQELRRRVWKPLEAVLAGFETVLVVPDGALCILPLAALPGSKPGTYLIEERSIAQLASARQLLEVAQEGPSPAEGLLALGGLAYGDEPRGADVRRGLQQWPVLPGTRLEVDRIVAVYRKAFPRTAAPRLLSGGDGNKVRLQRELAGTKDRPRPRYLHLATHGFRLEPPKGPTTALRTRTYLLAVRNPLLLSGIVLSAANRDPDGILTGEEVRGLDLRGTDLVVLSACKTGLGAVDSTEGVLGLQRAFHLAGARTTVASLWSVSDPATSVLMEQLYQRLWSGRKVSKLEALRQAQLYVLRNPDKVVARAKELRHRAGADRGLRGVEKDALVLVEGPKSPGKRSPAAWWAAFVLSGDIGEGE
jgi:tetratricopeptide (TPR) repeat protein/CHAT domain-containing protein